MQNLKWKIQDINRTLEKKKNFPPKMWGSLTKSDFKVQDTTKSVKQKS